MVSPSGEAHHRFRRFVLLVSAYSGGFNHFVNGADVGEVILERVFVGVFVKEVCVVAGLLFVFDFAEEPSDTVGVASGQKDLLGHTLRLIS